MKKMMKRWASFFARTKDTEKASPISLDEDLVFELDADYAEDHSMETLAEIGDPMEGLNLAPAEIMKDRDISSETLISFPFAKQSGLRLRKKEASLTVAAANTSLMVFGATGEGKTRSVAIPALRRLHELGCPGLVLDIVKSDYADLCRRFENALILGPVDDALPVNLIAGWNSLKFKGYLSAHVASYGSEDSFWGTEGVTDAVLVFDFIKEIRQEPPTLADIYDVFNQPVDFVKEVIRSLVKAPQSAVIRRIVDRVNGAYCMSLFHLGISNGRLIWPMSAGGAGGWGGSLKGGDEIARQFAWHSSKIMTLLRPFSENEKIKEKLCSKASVGTDFKSLIYLKRKVIVLDMPFKEYFEAATAVGQLLRMEYRDAIVSARALGRDLGYGKSRFSFTVIDEFQRYATGLGSAHGSSDETSWSDISREYGNINIYLTQSISSLRSSAACPAAVDTLVQNCRNIISLPTCDAPTLAFIDSLSLGDSTAAKKMVDLSPEREAFVYFARGGKNGATLSGVCKTSGSRYSYMSSELLSALLRLPKLWRAPAVVDSPSERSGAGSSAAGGAGCLGRVIAITTDQGHDGFIDFESRLLQGGYSIETVFSMPSRGDPKKRLAKALRRYAEQALPGDIVAIVRGGGDRSLMPMFDSDDACLELDALRARGAHVVMGVGHTKDRFAIEASCDSVRAVPFDAAIAVAAMLASRGLLKKARKLSADMRAADLEERGLFSDSKGVEETAELSEREAMSFLLDKEDCFGAKEGFEAWRLYAEHCKRHHIGDVKAIDELPFG